MFSIDVPSNAQPISFADRSSVGDFTVTHMSGKDLRKAGVPGRSSTNVLADPWEISLTGKTARRAA